jgi:hypothetical protein
MKEEMKMNRVKKRYENVKKMRNEKGNNKWNSGEEKKKK